MRIGFVYKIITDLNPDIIYIGSTLQGLSKRMVKHRTDYKNWKQGKSGKVMVFEYFDIYGIENFKIVELERYEVEDRQQLLKHEQEWMDKSECINKCNAYGRNIIKQQEWINKNVTKIKQYKKEYRIKNAEKNKEYLKNYYEENKEELLEKMKQYRKHNQDKIKEQEKMKYEKIRNDPKKWQDRLDKSYERRKGYCYDCDKEYAKLQDHYKTQLHLQNTLPLM